MSDVGDVEDVLYYVQTHPSHPPHQTHSRLMLCNPLQESIFVLHDMKNITLLSDFGLQDATVASVKGILLRQAPEAVITDISHLAEPFHMQQAAYLLQTAWRHFPLRTVHIVLFDVFSDRHPRLLLCEKEGHFFLAPDNGILALALDGQPEHTWECYELAPPDTFHNWVEACCYAVQSVFTGNVAQTYEACSMNVSPRHWQPVILPDRIECHVIHIDRFGNVILNLTQKLFEEVRQGRNFSIRFMRDEEINTLSNYYFDVPNGVVLCRFNKSGYMEIAVNQANATELLGLQINNKQQIIYNTIKVYFE